MKLALRYTFYAILLYAGWLGMMAVHEFGHVLHAWLSKGRVAAIHFGLLDFSETELSYDPHPLFVAWGGPIWGSLIPLMLLALLRKIHLDRLKWITQFFAGFCLIANGAYIAVGWTIEAGDAGVLIRHGASRIVMTIAGAIALACGLMLWHQLAQRRVASNTTHV